MRGVILGGILCSVCTPCLVYADLVVTEIMYNPPGTDSKHEWIEVYNSTDDSVQIAGLKLVQDSARHGIAGVDGSKDIAPGAYAVIAQNAAAFQSDYPSFSGALFHAALSLPNSTGDISIQDSKGIALADATYDGSVGANNDGNSLQRAAASQSFAPRAPTPGSEITEKVIKNQKTSSKQVSKSKKSSSKNSKLKTKNSTASSVDNDRYAPVETSSNDTSSSLPQTAAVASTRSPYAWYLALAAFTALPVIAYAAAREHRKIEWDVEEIEEDV